MLGGIHEMPLQCTDQQHISGSRSLPFYCKVHIVTNFLSFLLDASGAQREILGELLKETRIEACVNVSSSSKRGGGAGEVLELIPFQ